MTTMTTITTRKTMTMPWRAPLLALCLGLLAMGAGGCKKACNTEGFEEVWGDLADDFGDARLMGGKPMGCHA
ncbi:MAG TPA: hypothetical protein ENJ18_13940, partial [Nannocystis exedens]|nr:hypothetical protein [Nannocystis exedens]